MYKAEEITNEDTARYRLESLKNWPEHQGMSTKESILHRDLEFAIKLIDCMGYSWEKVVTRAKQIGSMSEYRRQMQALFAPA